MVAPSLSTMVWLSAPQEQLRGLGEDEIADTYKTGQHHHPDKYDER